MNSNWFPPFGQCGNGIFNVTNRSRASFFMNKFQKLGFIEYNGSIEVHSSLLNVILHDQPQIKT